MEVSAVGNVHHIVIANTTVKKLYDLMYVTLRRTVWICHKPEYEMRWSPFHNEWIVRSVTNGVFNWSHPPEGSIKLIALLSGNCEDDGITEPNDYLSAEGNRANSSQESV